jgi:putative peptide zinc metalloprotease protein
LAFKFRPDLDVSYLDEGQDKVSVILRDPVTEKFYRLSLFEFEFLQALDGVRSIPEALAFLADYGYHYSEEDANAIVERSGKNGLLLGTRAGTAEYQIKLRDQTIDALRARRFSEVFFLFIPLFNPDRFLEATLWIFKLFYNKGMAIVLGIAALGAGYLVIDALPKFKSQYLFFFNLENLIYLWVTLGFTKFFHEFGHAYTAKSYGLRVPQMGVAFLIFFPCLYCNTTDAWRLADRKQRMAIGMAGIAADFALAVIATYIWHFSKPGIINSLSFYLVGIALISTVFFNANPYVRFDGYYVLSDYLRIPNLMMKSRGYLRYLFLNRVLGLSQVENPAKTRRENLVFSIHGAGVFVYRLFLYGGIIAGVYYRFDKTLGIILALLALSIFAVYPLTKGIANLYRNRRLMNPKLIGIGFFAALVAGVMIVLLVPMTKTTVYPCYLTSSVKQKIATPLMVPVRQVYVRQGSAVKRGAVLFDLDTNELEYELAKKTIDMERLKKQIDLFMLDDSKRARAAEKRLELEKLRFEVDQIRRDLNLADQGVTAPFDGVVTRLEYHVQEGFQPGKGAILGEMMSCEGPVVYALIDGDDLSRVEEDQSVEIWFPIGTGLTLKGKAKLIRPYHERDLRNSSFSSAREGEIATEVQESDKSEMPISPIYQCVVNLASNEHGIPLGITGRLVVPSPPRSLLISMWERTVKAFNRESLF